MTLFIALMVAVAPVGQDAFSHLHFGVGARELAMGGAVTAACNGAFACHWNPAALARVAPFSVVAFDYPSPTGEWDDDGLQVFDGDEHVYAAGAFSAGRLGVFALGLDNLSVGGIEVRYGETKEWEYRASYSETALLARYAVGLTDAILLGCGLDILWQSFTTAAGHSGEAMSSFGVAGALGLEYRFAGVFLDKDSLRVGLSARLPTRMRWSGTADFDTVHQTDLTAQRAALGGSWNIRDEDGKGWLFSLDLAARSRRHLTASLGVEWVLVRSVDMNGFVALRAGVRDLPLVELDASASPALTVGFGFGVPSLPVTLDAVLGYRTWSSRFDIGDYVALGLTVGR